jgi:hypothetical protein
LDDFEEMKKQYLDLKSIDWRELDVRHPIAKRDDEINQ